MKTNLMLAMRRFGLVALLAAGTFAAAAEPPAQIEWVRQFSFGAGRVDSIRRTAVDASGVYAVGQTQEDAFVVKFDPSGNELWRRTFSTARIDDAYAVAVDATGVYVGGWAGGPLPGQVFAGGDDDAVLRKYDHDGNEIWTREFGTKSPEVENYGRDHIIDLVLTADAIYLAGDTEGPLPGQVYLGASDAFLRKYDKAGNELWTRQFGTVDFDGPSAVVADATGVYIAGHTGPAGPDRFQAYVRKYDHSGSLLWVREFGAPGVGNYVGGMAIDPTGIYISGSTRGAIPGQTWIGLQDSFLRKYSTDGAELWTRQFGTPVDDGGGEVVCDATGLYVSNVTRGTFPGQTPSGGEDIVVQRRDLEGNVVWTIQFGTALNDGTPSVSQGASGLYLGGATQGTFPGQVSAGNWDALIVKLQRAPTVSAGPDVTVASTDQPGKFITGTATDPDGDLLAYKWFEGTAPVSPWLYAGADGSCPLDISAFSLGTHTLTLTANDGVFEGQDTMVLTIVDTEPPTLAPEVDTSVLWPPNHQMVDVTIWAHVTDNGSGPLSLAVTVSSNEPENGLGDGDTGPDWTPVTIDQVNGALSLGLRAERGGSGSGRIYAITITATDAAGNSRQAQVFVTVPLIKPKG